MSGKKNGGKGDSRAGQYPFSGKTYGDCTFPAGNYDALRICIGEAKGKNWWCVLFPSLCFVDTVHGIVPAESRQLLQKVLTEEEYESLFTPGKK
ncbi:MAG: stage II sporulation protein R [Blautia sp.]